jgi:hypothetical protein
MLPFLSKSFRKYFSMGRISVLVYCFPERRSILSLKTASSMGLQQFNTFARSKESYITEGKETSNFQHI